MGIKNWLFAIDEPTCYIRPFDVLVATASLSFALQAAVADVEPPWHAILVSLFFFELSGFTVYFALRRALRMRD